MSLVDLYQFIIIKFYPMGNNVSSEEHESGAMIPSGSAVSGALSSLWNTSSDKDDTCVQWGLVCRVLGA